MDTTTTKEQVDMDITTDEQVDKTKIAYDFFAKMLENDPESENFGCKIVRTIQKKQDDDEEPEISEKQAHWLRETFKKTMKNKGLTNKQYLQLMQIILMRLGTHQYIDIETNNDLLMGLANDKKMDWVKLHNALKK